MEIPKHPLTIKQSNFLNKLRSYLPEKIYFYGSILRDDFLPGISDIDVLYFSKENLQSSVHKLYNLLTQDSSATRIQMLHFLYHSSETKKVISGYKIKYTNVDNGVIIELSMYDDENKELIMKEQLQKARIPLFIVYALLILKILAYKYRVLPEDTFRLIKDKLFIFMSGIKNTFLPIYHEERK